MAITRTPIAEASDQQIRDFCELQQLDVSSAKTRADLLGVLGPAWEHDFITAQVADPAPVGSAEAVDAAADAAAHAEQTQRVDAPVLSIGTSGADDPKVRLKIGSTTYMGGKDPVTVSVNGTTTLVARDVEVEMPYRYYLALKNAIREDVEQNTTTGDISVSEFTNYPLSVSRFPSDAEVAEWHARTDHIELGGAVAVKLAA